MWWLLGILGGLTAIITVILLLPVYVIIRSDDKGELELRYRFLGKLYGEDPDPNNPIVVQLKKVSGVSRIEKQLQDVKKTDRDELKESIAILRDLLKEVVAILKYCKATTFRIHAVCAEPMPSDTAITYGWTVAAVQSFSAFLSSVMKVRKRGRDLQVVCDYASEKSELSYELVVRVFLFRALAALWRLAMEEVKRDQS